jgi:hypothetical protein
MKKNATPKWFTGELYVRGGKAINPYTKESIELTALELSIYDYIRGWQNMISTDLYNVFGCSHLKKANREFLKARDWFATHNPQAYKILID